MSTRPLLGCLLRTKSTAIAPDVAYAVVTLSESRVNELIGRMAEATTRRKEEGPFLRLSFMDNGGVRFLRSSERFRGMADARHKSHELYQAVLKANRTQRGQLILYTALRSEQEVEEHEVEVYAPTMNIYNTGIIWEAQREGAFEILKTSNMGVVDLLLARLYYAPAAERDTVFRELAHADPDAAVLLLEEGLRVAGMGTLEVGRELTPEALVPLLEHEEELYRQKAIIALGSLNTKSATRLSRSHR